MADIGIKDGPSKLDLMFTLFMSKDGGGMRTLTFTLNDGRKLETTLHEVGVEDGSHESWLLKGEALSDAIGLWNGYYDTRSRTGHIHIPNNK